MKITEVATSIDGAKLVAVPRIVEASSVCIGWAARPTQDIMKKLCGGGLSQTELLEIVSAAMLTGFQAGYVTGLLHPEERPTLTGIIRPLT